MATMSATDEAVLRLRIGDSDDAAYDLTTDQLNALYTHESEDLNRTTVAALEALVALARDDTSYGIAGTSESLGQKFDHRKELLDHWRKQVGRSGIVVSATKVYRGDFGKPD